MNKTIYHFKYRFICKILLLLLTISFGQNLLAQIPNQLELEERRKRLLTEIKNTTIQLNQAQKNKASALQQYLQLKSRIKKRQQLIATLQEEVTLLDGSIERNTVVITSLNEDAERLRQEYAKMLRTAYRQKMNDSRWIFLLSSQNINSAVQRWRYLKQYDDYRKKQAQLILETKGMLELKVEQLGRKKLEKEELITSESQQKNILGKELSKKNSLLGQLKSNESRLAKSLESQQEEKAKLDRAINTVISAIAAKNKAVTGTEDKAKIVKEASEFQGMFGRLPWPVSNGRITQSFGRHPHPEYENVITENNGINISTTPNAIVQAVYSGKVVGRQFIPGNQNMLIIAHGTYYTVYSNLETADVQKGDQVKSGQTIGRLSTSDSELHFEVWKEKKRLNPAKWIR